MVTIQPHYDLTECDNELIFKYETLK